MCVGPFSEPPFKIRFCGQPADRGFEFLYVIHNGGLTQTNQEFPDYTRSAFWGEILVEIGWGIIHGCH
jgi:hypothetical protein